MLNVAGPTGDREDQDRISASTREADPLWPGKSPPMALLATLIIRRNAVAMTWLLVSRPRALAGRPHRRASMPSLEDRLGHGYRRQHPQPHSGVLLSPAPANHWGRSDPRQSSQTTATVAARCANSIGQLGEGIASGIEAGEGFCRPRPQDLEPFASSSQKHAACPVAATVDRHISAPFAAVNVICSRACSRPSGQQPPRTGTATKSSERPRRVTRWPTSKKRPGDSGSPRRRGRARIPPTSFDVPDIVPKHNSRVHPQEEGAFH